MTADNESGRIAQTGIQAEITIRLMDNGQISLNGPLHNKMLVYGILECAKDALRELGAKQEQPLIMPVTVVPKFGN